MKMNDELIHTLAECIATSENCMAQCLKSKNPDKMADCIQSSWNCSTTVASSLQDLYDDEKRTHTLLQDCIDVCKECEEVCRKYNDFYSQICADACEKCYIACEESMEMAQVA